MATLNITHNGLSQDYALELDGEVTDADVKRIATELQGVPAPTFEHFVVDRMQNGERIYLRPKVPFGGG